MHADPEDIQGPYFIPLIRRGQYEHRDGDEHGRGRFRGEAI